MKFNKDLFIQARKNAGFSQQQTSNLLGVSLSTVSLWERGMYTPNEDVRPAVLEFIKKYEESEGINE